MVEPNRGQTAAEVDFVARPGGQSVGVTGGGPVFTVPDPAGGADRTVRLDLVGARPAGAEARQPTAGASSYLIGGDRSGRQPASMLSSLSTTWAL